MPEVFHADPSCNNPNPRHDSREDHERWVISHDWQGGIVFELGRCVGRSAHVPCPAPYVQARAHADDEDEPRHDQNDPSPPLCLAVVVIFDCLWERAGRQSLER